MNIDNKYTELCSSIEEIVLSRKNKKLYMAMGYTTNLDLVHNLEVNQFNDLLKKYNITRYIPKKHSIINTVEDFLETILHFAISGIGGEVSLLDKSIIYDVLKWNLSIGGTAVQAAKGLDGLGCPSIVHLTDDSREVLDILDTENILTINENNQLVGTKKIKTINEQQPHFIIQFKKGDVIECGKEKYTIKNSNRLIVAKITVNKHLPLNKHFFNYIENNAKSITSNVLSSFNYVNDLNLLNEKLSFIIEHIDTYKKNNVNGITYFEDAYFHSLEIKLACMEKVYNNIDILSLNEEELAYNLSLEDIIVDIDSIDSVLNGLLFIRNKYTIKVGIVLHTKDYALFYGDVLKDKIENGLYLGNILATSRALSGEFPNPNTIKKVLELGLSEKGVDFYNQAKQKKYSNITIVPSKYIDKPKFTIGLGDTFVAGMQLCFD